MLQNLVPITKEGSEKIQLTVEVYTLEVFQKLNQHLNQMGLCLAIAAIESEEDVPQQT